MLQAVTPNAPCKVCGKAFIRFSSLESAVICGAKRCLSGYVKGLDKTRKDDLKRRKEAVKTRSEYIKEAQYEFNKYIRHRDVGRLCICCDLPLGGDAVGGFFDCGHYRSVGSAPHLRFNEHNAHGQRKQCNRWGAGRAVDYRIGLIKRIGAQAVEVLEARQESSKWSVEDLKSIRDHYRALTRQLLKEKEA